MEFGTISFEGKIFNLNYMANDEIKKLLNNVEEKNRKCFTEVKKIIRKQQ